MKVIIASAAALLVACAASAQYTPVKQGMALNYKTTNIEKNEEIHSTDSVVNVTNDGTATTVHIKSCLHTDNTFADELVFNTTSTFTTPDEPTTIVIMSGEEFRQFVLRTVKMAMEEAGQYTESNFNEFAQTLKAKGDLTLTLNPKGAPGDKIPNSRLRLDMGMQAATMFVSNGTIVGFEDVTVEAGTFTNCIKISYEKRESSPEGSSKEYITAWYAPEIGLVKEESADKKGNISSTQQLISY